MREGFGGTFMMAMMMVFVVVFVSFLALALNYAKTYRVKNKIIDIIEQNQGFNSVAQGKIETALTNFAYNGKLPSGVEGSVIAQTNVGDKYCSNKGYCVTLKEKSVDGGVTFAYYQVDTYLTIDLPRLILTNEINVSISGETIPVKVTG